MSFKSLIIVVISAVNFAILVTVGNYFVKPPEHYTSAFTHEEIEEIDPWVIIDNHTLLYPELVVEELKTLNSKMVENRILVSFMGFTLINPDAIGFEVPVIIQSRGGSVEISDSLKMVFKALKENGIKIHCYVGEAQSAAFNILVTSCDKVTAKKGAVLMQHRTGRRVDMEQTPATFRIDTRLSREEANALGVSYKEWHNLARGEKDHVFTPEEITKYKLVDEWM